jgi:two-component system, NtrC family, response regulator
VSQRYLLIIEDDPGLQSQMRWCFADQQVQIAVAANESEAIAAVRRNPPQVVTLDLGLPPDPGGSNVGFGILKSIRSLLPDCKIIVVTGREEHEHAVRAVAEGAYDFYQKPIDADTLRFAVERAFRLADLEQENRHLVAAQEPASLGGIISGCKSMQDLCRLVERVAPTDASVLILGETGTGKELVARAIHDLSARREQRFVAINCAAIPENLLESELFGYEKGAFTGAVARKLGRIEMANGGTLFLDEIGDMPLPLQSKILRFLQERSLERVGGHNLITVDVRVVCATHRPIGEMLAAKTFREDLYFRLAEITVSVPPLRSREGDPALLAHVFLRRFAPDRKLRISDDAISALNRWNWPGNVRELENRVKRASIMADAQQISARDLDLAAETDPDDAFPLNLKRVRDEAELKAVTRALVRADHNLAQASRLLGISRPTLYNLLEKFHIDHHGE